MELDNIPKLLTIKGIHFFEKGNDYVISCLNPDHDDSNPSLKIDRNTGKFHCFSCGFKGDVFTHFGEYRSKTYDLLYDIESQINNILIEARGLEIPESSVPFSQEFRGIRPETFTTFSAFTHTDPDFLNRVVFPIYDISGKIPAFVGRYTHSNATPKYKVYPPAAKLPLYPIPKNTDTVVLVEGLFDVVNLHDKGLPIACAIFGTHTITWKTVEDKLAPLLAAGVHRIVLLLDSDYSGRLSTKKLTDMIESKTDCKVFDASSFLDDGQDAGDLSEREVSILKDYIKKLIANKA